MLNAILTALLVLFALQDAGAPVETPTRWEVDGSHSTVLFKVSHLGTSNFYGVFLEKSGAVEFDPAKLGDAKVDVKVASDSIETFAPNRNAHMKRADFFDVDEHPEIRFRAEGFEKTSQANEYRVTGTLTLRGVEKPLEVIVRKTGESNLGTFGPRIGFETTFTIDRFDHGIEFDEKLLGREVELTIALELVPAAS